MSSVMEIKTVTEKTAIQCQIEDLKMAKNEGVITRHGERLLSELESLSLPSVIGSSEHDAGSKVIDDFKECYDYLQLTDFQRENLETLLRPRLRIAFRDYR